MFTSRDLTIQQLRCFVAVADEGQFTAAADELRLAQPSISAQIHRLEQVLGVSLFHRGRRPIALTDAGASLLPLARRVLRGVDDVFQGADELESLRRGHVTIGTTPSIGATLLPLVFARFRERYPNVSISFVERHSEEIVQSVESGILDLALVVGPLVNDTLEQNELATERMVLVVGADHPLAARDTIAIRELRGVPLVMFHQGYDVRAATVAAFERAGFAPTIAIDGAEMATAHSFVAAGIGVAIVPSIVATLNDDLHVIHIDDQVMERTICLVRDVRHTLSRAATALRDEVIEFLAEGSWPNSDDGDLQLATVWPPISAPGPE